LILFGVVSAFRAAGKTVASGLHARRRYRVKTGRPFRSSLTRGELPDSKDLGRWPKL